MLILKRRVDQSLQIGPDVTISVLGIESGAVILGISAPAGLTVSRVSVRQEPFCVRYDPADTEPSDGPARCSP